MNTQETAGIVRHIDAAVQAVVRRININTWIFTLSLAITAILMIMLIYALVWLSRVNVTAESNKAIALEANKLAVEASTVAAANTARYDTLFKQYSDYINQNVAAWNKLQKDNVSGEDVKRRGIKVPVAPILRPAGLPEPSDRDLDRITRILPAPTPIVKKQKVYIHDGNKKRVTAPSPKPWYDFFKTTR